MAQETKKENEEPQGETNRAHKVISQGITEEMKASYIDYAMSVITARALPDVRDGLKPVHRRILYAMHELNLSHTSRFRKSAAVVGEVLGKYHPHGDIAVYDAMVKMAQEFSYRYPLVMGQGNFGSVDGDSPAAMRYTEAKMSRIAGELLHDIEKETVDWTPNYDKTKNEPVVFPSAVPGLLLNGTLGIAVGMATNIPPHNLSEVMSATMHLIDEKEATNEDLLTFVKGPDFPTAGIIYNVKDIAHAYATGRGGVLVRAETEIVEDKNGSFQIVVSSLPYRVNKAELIIKIAGLVAGKKIEGIKGLRDESARGELRVVIDIKGGAQPQSILNYLFKHTDLETMFHFNMLGLIDGVPQTLSLKTILEEFISHREIVVTRRTEFELKKAKAREHILLGLKKALDHIDEIIKLIKASKDATTAHAGLIKKYKLSKLQATAILEMRLQKLAGLEQQKIHDELVEIQKTIGELETLLGSKAKIRGVIKEELGLIKEKYGDERRTKVVKSGVRSFSAEDLIPEEESALVLTQRGYIKRTNPKEYRPQKRGGVGVVDLNTKEEDFITTFLTTSTHSTILFFSNKGKVYQTKMFEIPEGRRATRGKSIMNFLPLSEGEYITSVVPFPKGLQQSKEGSLAMVTHNGVIKKVAVKNFTDVRRSGILAITLKKGDTLFSAFFVGRGDDIIVVTREGQSIRFKEKDVREMGRTAGGVRALKLLKSDEVMGADVIEHEEKNPYLLVMSEKGHGKKTALKEYKTQARGGSGIKTVKLTEKTGKLMVAKVVTESYNEIIAVSKHGQVIRTQLSEIPKLGRQTQGVRVMKLRANDRVATFICL
ncbi:MAG: DNA gyrase subunit A [Candidatus Paceibacterota bacterium]